MANVVEILTENVKQNHIFILQIQKIVSLNQLLEIGQEKFVVLMLINVSMKNVQFIKENVMLPM